MEISEIKAVIGTNAWGSAAYETLLRGSAVDEQTLREAIARADSLDMAVFDTAQDYGLGKCQPMIGRLCGKDAVISAKYTPMSGTYQAGQVRKSLEKDLAEMHRDWIDIYWLHLPNAYRENLQEMIALYREGKIRHIGVSNFNMAECQEAKAILDGAGIPLYGVQNHYSLLNRDWESCGLVQWCRDNGIAFWAWAVLEEGVLAGRRKKDEKWTIMKGLFGRKRKKLECLFTRMEEIGSVHGLTVAQVAMAFAATKGIVPVCGCRRPEQVQQLYDASRTALSAVEMSELEQVADALNVRIFGKDIFRFAVKRPHGAGKE